MKRQAEAIVRQAAFALRYSAASTRKFITKV